MLDGTLNSAQNAGSIEPRESVVCVSTPTKSQQQTVIMIDEEWYALYLSSNEQYMYRWCYDVP